MSETFPEITYLSKHAANYMAVHGWLRHTMWDESGAVCLTGALYQANDGNAQPGDWAIARSVFRARGRGESWNDRPERTEAEVIAELERTHIYDADLLETFGAQWRQIVELTRRATTLSPDQRDKLRRPRAYSLRIRACADVAESVLAATGRSDIRDAALAAVFDRAASAGEYAALALCARDLVGKYSGWGQAEYDELTSVWRSVVGPVHPDDGPAS